MSTEQVQVEEINSAEIESVAKAEGATALGYIGRYEHPEHLGEND